ncbi:MAG TPA: DUF4129 domain-containing protein [Dehalococcoidales bacterium]|nr:DUF4129 domain-containing protein [Dehalococcoidales bacterium]
MRPTRPSTLFYFAFLGMELSYLYLLTSLLAGPVYTLILTLLLYPLALLSKLVPRSAVPQRIRFSLEVALVILVILIVAGERLLGSLAIGQADVLGIILRMGLCGLTWWLGYTVPHEQVNYSTVALRLQIGILAVLVFSQVAGSAPPVFLFFLLAPMALFLARWASSFFRGATVLRSPNLNHLLLAGASVMVPGIALILLLSPSVARTIVDWLRIIFLKLSDWLDAQQKAAATPSGEFKFNFSCSMRPEQAVPPPTPMPTPPPPSEGATGISPVVIWIIVFIIFLAIVALIAFALRRRKGRRTAHPTEPVRFQLRMVSLGVLRSLLYLFPQLLRKLWLWLILLFQRWRKRPKQSEEPLLSIRALYRNLLSWAARQGVARIPSQTPLEHLELLEHKFPPQQDDLKRVTEGYLLARYSQKTVSQEEFDRIKKAWQRAVAYHTP